MKRLVHLFSFQKEAWLFDSRLYILKTFLSVVTAYAIASYIPLIRKDMISLLFGLLLTLEPVTLTGIRSGLSQIYATTLGALLTAVIITLFGINIWTVALSIAVTLFVTLKINWKVVSVVALFTAIYMTQYVQLDAAGLPSAYLTFQLRIAALGTGVFVAILYNFLFSLFSYKRMEEKRIAYILHSIQSHISQITEGIDNKNTTIIRAEQNNLPHTFNDIDWTYSLLLDKEKEYRFKDKLHLPTKNDYNNALKVIIRSLRNITHLIYDMSYHLGSANPLVVDKNIHYHLKDINNLLESYAYYFEHNHVKYNINITLSNNINDKHVIKEGTDFRIMHNIEEIYKNLSTVDKEIVNNNM